MYDFDEIIDRRHTNAVSTDGFRREMFHAGAEMTFPFRDEDFIRMWVADMDFATPEVVVQAMRERLDRRIFGYTRAFDAGYYEAFSAWCRSRYGWSFPREELMMGSGVVPALYELVAALCRPEDQVLFLTPSYGPFRGAAEASRRTWVGSDLRCENGEYTVDFADLERKAADPRTTVLIFCNPHNPTGRIWTEEELRRVGEIAVRHDLWLISDEIHCDLLRSGARHVPLGKVLPDYEKLVTCMAPSKTFNMAGLMISNVLIRSRALRHTWRTVHSGTDNPLSLAAAQAAYEQGGPWLEDLLVYLDENFRFVRDYLAQHLPLARFRIPQATYLAWVDLSRYFRPGEDLARFLAYQAGVLVDDGSMFVRNAEGFVRLNLAAPRSVVAEGLRRICWAVNTKIQYTGLPQG
nr:MalY/PatB family protein [uncultured Dysosmobacter sp.]